VKLGHICFIVGLSTLATGCSTYSSSRYSINTDNVVALRDLKGKKINVGSFTATKSGTKQIMCRGVGPIKTPDGETFSEFVKKGLVDELKVAGLYSVNAPVTLTGNLDKVDFSSASGNWSLALTIHSSNGKSFSVAEKYAFTSSFYGETACNQTAQALMPAVQDLLGKVVRSSKFSPLLRA
tara:strand:+ start:117 stop:659 length:543 start_codon:yes stop_codon:yes gene_type:complete